MIKHHESSLRRLGNSPKNNLSKKKVERRLDPKSTRYSHFKKRPFVGEVFPGPGHLADRCKAAFLWLTDGSWFTCVSSGLWTCSLISYNNKSRSNNAHAHTFLENSFFEIAISYHIIIRQHGFDQTLNDSFLPPDPYNSQPSTLPKLSTLPLRPLPCRRQCHHKPIQRGNLAQRAHIRHHILVNQ